jgi:hypothetical protein
VFLVNSRLSQFLAACSPPAPQQSQKLLRHPFFRRYGVNLPSSLTEGRSFTWGEFPLPTGVGLRYGHIAFWLAAFLGGLGSRRLPRTCVRSVLRSCSGDRDLPRSRTSNKTPGLSTCQVHAPYRVPASLSNERMWCRTLYLLSIAYDCDVLGLGPD